MNEAQLKEIILKTITEMVGEEGQGRASAAAPQVEPGEVPDLSAVDYRQVLDVPDPANEEEYRLLRSQTVARLGVWRAGPRYRTNTFLRFRADHAVAMDAVFTDVPEDLLEKAGLFTVQTLCDSKDTYLTRPDLGRRFSDETVAELRKRCVLNPDIQIVASDGLSSTSITANLLDVLPAILQGLKASGATVGTPFFIKYGRVGAMDAVTEALGAKVTVILLGERPGLATGESMSAYMTYGGYIGIPEASRTVVSNIHRGGTTPTEAGAFIAELCLRMLKEKASGLDLKV
ncbi:MAG TPA: ethanolamine ammonia-lyase subunit EutC [Candidatus Intestinimonas stercorigallinarum]|nr:ethanolamine ammonia-lyase subunit EutC [Candidatus Intestinimonas stercorigallinarum]